MSEIEIDHKDKIFNDPVSCKKTGKGFCPHEKNGYCEVFHLYLHDNGYVYLKCDECKTAYQKTLKEKEVKKCSNCKTEIHDDSIEVCPACDFIFPVKEEPKEKVENPCSECGKEWDCAKTDYCPHCGNVVPF